MNVKLPISIFIVCSSICSTALVNGQGIQRQIIASAGNNMNGNGIQIQQTIGQAYITTSTYEDGLTYSSGFQQAPKLRSGVKSFNYPFTLKVFPNPTSSTVKVFSSGFSQQAYIKVFDMSGNVILRENIENSDIHTINCSQWPDGTYLVRIRDGEKEFISKLIIRK